LGKIARLEDLDKNNTFAVEDIKIFEQEVSHGGTLISQKDLASFYDELMEKGEDPSVWKLWWHSHASMDVFWSGTDEETIEDFDNETEKDNWLLSIVTNLDGDILNRLDIFSPFRIKKEGLPWEIIFDDPIIPQEIIDEVREKVKTKKWFSDKKEEKKIIWPNKDNKENIVGRLFNKNNEVIPTMETEIIIEGLQGPRRYDD
jgi:hypothetical protein